MTIGRTHHQTHRFVLFATVTFAALAAVLVMSSVAGAGTTDPRKCTYNKAAQCANSAAVVALRRKMTLVTEGHPGVNWSADITCVNRSPKFLLWSCSWKNPQPPYSKAVVKFWATSSGWKVAVTLS